MKKPRQITPRVCVSCGVDHGITGPRPYGSAIKMVDGELLYACQACAPKLGWWR